MVGHLLLVGMMGTGKSTVGREVATSSGRRFVDLDGVIEAEAGLSIAEIFVHEGEPAFRRRESEALAAVLASATGALVVATGGGCVLDAGNRRLLGQSGTVVWLRATPAVLVERLRAETGGIDARPLLAADDADAQLAALEASRAPLYAEVADHVVDVDHRSVGELASTILALVEEAS